MTVLQIAQLIVLLWPHLEKLLAAIENEAKRNEVKESVEKDLIAALLKGV